MKVYENVHVIRNIFQLRLFLICSGYFPLENKETCGANGFFRDRKFIIVTMKRNKICIDFGQKL
jgi:hypothetical protein